MRAFSSTLQNALLSRSIVFRDFLWIIARDRSTGNPYPYGFWSDVGSVSVQVVNPLSQSAVTRSFEGAGTLISISDIPAVSNLTVQTITIEMSQINDSVAATVRGYDLKQARVEVFSGYFDPNSRALLEPAFCRFQGFVDKSEIKTPKEGEAGSIVLTCNSHLAELTRSNPDTRSHATQQNRSYGDGFFQDVAAVGDWNIEWGRYSSTGGGSNHNWNVARG